MFDRIKKFIKKVTHFQLTVEDTEERAWDKYYGDIPKHIEYPNCSIYDMFNETFRKHPLLNAYNYYGKKANYTKMHLEVNTVAKSLVSIGVKAKDTILICMPNTPEAIILFYAANKIGAISSLIHPLSSEKEIEYYIKKCKAKYILCLDLMFNKVKIACEKCDINNIIVAKINNSMPHYLSILYTITNKHRVHIDYDDTVISWNKFFNKGLIKRKDPYIKTYSSDEAVILYSGGTTGEPKAVVLTNLNFNALGLQCFKMTDPAKVGDTILTIMPIFHGFGIGVCVHTAMCNGMNVTLIPQFKANEFYKLIKKYKPQFLAGVPTMYEALINSPINDKNYLSCVGNVICGGDLLNENLRNRINTYLKDHGSEAGIRVGYGLTECTGASCLTPRNYFKEGAIGVPFSDTIYKIVKIGTLEDAAVNEAGEICISGPTVMKKYLDNKEETKTTLIKHSDGKIYLHTGDIGYIDEHGIVCFESRLKRMIITSGYNIYPNYIERIVTSHAAVKSCAIVGIPHPYKMQVAKAYIVIEKNFDYDDKLLDDIKKYNEKFLAKYELPYEYEVLDELPVTKLGKVDYKALDERNKKK